MHLVAARVIEQDGSLQGQPFSRAFRETYHRKAARIAIALTTAAKTESKGIVFIVLRPMIPLDCLHARQLDNLVAEGEIPR